MNARDQEQVDLCRCYLLQLADRSRSRLVRDQIRRWVQWVEAVQNREREERRSVNRETNCLKAA